MKKAVYLFIVIFIAMGAMEAQAQQSDFATVERFRQQYELIKHQTKMATRSSQLALLNEEMDSLFTDFENHEELINKSMYPATFDDMSHQLSTDMNIGMQRLLVIENQREQLFDLNNKVFAYQQEITKLNTRSDSLRNEIATSMASEERLSGMVRSYRQQLEQRDALVFDMIDSLLMTYRGLENYKALAGDEVITEIGTTSKDHLEWVMSIIQENIDQASARTGYLQVEDYLRMYSLETSFERAWDQIGDKMVTVYGGKNKEEWASNIDDKLKEWRMVTSQNMWKSIDHYLDYNEIELAAFDNRESFYTGLEDFMNNGISRSEDELLTTKSYQEYLKLKEFWNDTYKNEWNDALQDVNILSVAEVASIDQKLEKWGDEARPIHPMLVAIISLLIVSLSGFILVMVKSKKVR